MHCNTITDDIIQITMDMPNCKLQECDGLLQLVVLELNCVFFLNHQWNILVSWLLCAVVTTFRDHFGEECWLMPLVVVGCGLWHGVFVPFECLLGYFFIFGYSTMCMVVVPSFS
jgi:hypothetical protein